MAKCAQPSNWWALLFSQKLLYGQTMLDPAIVGIIVLWYKDTSDVAVDQVGMDVRVKFCDSTLNSGWIIHLFAGWTSFTHFCAVFNCILVPTESS